MNNIADNSLQKAIQAYTCSLLYLYPCRYLRRLTLFEDCLVNSERKVVQFYFKSNVILKLHISSMLPVTSAIQSDILQLYLQAVDTIYISHQPYMHSIPVLTNCHG